MSLLRYVYADAPGFVIERTGFWAGKAARMVYILGQRRLGWNSTTVLGDCARYLDTSQDNLNAVVGGTTYYIVSTSVNDTAAGSGARTVRIVYLDSAGNQQVTTATLNGTGAVSLGTTIYYVQWMEVASLGAGFVAAGDIAIGTVNGAQTVASTVEMIAAGGNRSLSARYKVPTGYVGYLTGWDAGAISTTMDTRLRATVFADDRALSTVTHFQDTMYLNASFGSADIDYLPCPAGSEIKVSAIPGAAPSGNRLDASFRIALVAV